MKKLWSATEFFCILYFFLFSSFLVCSYFPNRKLMDYPQVAGGWGGREDDSLTRLCHVVWWRYKIQHVKFPIRYEPRRYFKIDGRRRPIEPPPDRNFFAFKNPPPPKTSLGHQKSGKEKSPNGRPCYHLSWYFREWLLILLASGQWIFRLYLFIRPSFSFSFSSLVQPSTGALTNRKTEPTE